MEMKDVEIRVVIKILFLEDKNAAAIKFNSTKSTPVIHLPQTRCIFGFGKSRWAELIFITRSRLEKKMYKIIHIDLGSVQDGYGNFWLKSKWKIEWTVRRYNANLPVRLREAIRKRKCGNWPLGSSCYKKMQMILSWCTGLELSVRCVLLLAYYHLVSFRVLDIRVMSKLCMLQTPKHSSMRYSKMWEETRAILLQLINWSFYKRILNCIFKCMWLWYR